MSLPCVALICGHIYQIGSGSTVWADRVKIVKGALGGLASCVTTRPANAYSERESPPACLLARPPAAADAVLWAVASAHPPSIENRTKAKTKTQTPQHHTTTPTTP